MIIKNSIIHINRINVPNFPTKYVILRQLCTNTKANPKSLAEKNVRVAVIGVPNAGKSTFINNLINHRICPTSNKVHTTRNSSRAICTRDNSQIILFDTPGLVTETEMKKHHLESSFASSWRSSIQNADLVGVIHDISNKWTRNQLHPTVLESLRLYPKIPSFLVMNKVDLLKSKRVLLDTIKCLTNNTLKYKGNVLKNNIVLTAAEVESTHVEKMNSGWSNFSEVFMVSSMTGDGLEKVMQHILSHGKSEPWEYSAKEFTDQTPESLIVSSVRARLLDYLPQEIPYLLKSAIEYFNQENGKIYASVEVSCPNRRIERLVSGESSGKLRQITERVTSDLVETFGVPVSLTITTVVDQKQNQ